MTSNNYNILDENHVQHTLTASLNIKTNPARCNTWPGFSLKFGDFLDRSWPFSAIGGTAFYTFPRSAL